MLSIIFIIFLLLIGYWHFMQGLLGGFISAVIAICAGAVAFSYYEPAANALSGGKFNDSAQGVCMLALFAITYMVLRVIADMFVPGSIRLNSTFDGVGGAVFGLVAGMVALGIAALAIQSMPMGPSIGGYARYSVNDPRPDVKVTLPEGVPGGGRQYDRKVNDELKAERLETGEQNGMLLPFDDFVCALYGHLSDAGSLAADKPLKSIHPNLPQEFFAQRIGLEASAHHTVLNTKTQQAKLVDVYVVDDKVLKNNPRAVKGGLPRTPSELKSIRADDFKQPLPPLVPESGKVIVIVGVHFSTDAADEKDGGDRFVRLGASGVRLVAPDASGEWKNNFPLGTFEDYKVWANRPDDYLFINVGGADAGARFVFEVDASALDMAMEGGKPVARFKEGVFVEVKRGGKFALSDTDAKLGIPADNRSFWPMRKVELKKPTAAPPPGEQQPPVAVNENPQPTTPSNPGIIPKIPDRTADPTPPTPTPPTPTPPTPAPGGDNGWNDAPLTSPALVATGANLPLPVNVGDAGAELDVLTSAVTGVVKGRKFASMDITPGDPGAAPAELAKGSPVRQLTGPAGTRIVQVRLTPKTAADWGWADNLGQFSVVDAENKPYKVRGAMTVATLADKSQRVTGQYDGEKDLGTLHKVDNSTAGPVTLFFVLPQAAKAVEIRYQDKEGGVKLEK